MATNELAMRRALGWAMLVLFLLMSVALAPLLSATACPGGALAGGGDCVTTWQSVLGVETGWALWLGSSGVFLVIAVLVIVVVPRLSATRAAR